VEGWTGGSSLRRTEAEHLVAAMLLEGFFKEDFLISPYNTISYLVEGQRGENGLNNLIVYTPKICEEEKPLKKKRSGDEMAGRGKKKHKIMPKNQTTPELIELVESD